MRLALGEAEGSSPCPFPCEGSALLPITVPTGDREATALILGSVVITITGNAFWGLVVVVGVEGSHYVALAGLEFSIYYEQRSACLCLLNSPGILKHMSPHLP